MATLTYLASALIWFTIAAVLVVILFRAFSIYVNNMGDAATDAITGAGL